MNLRHSLHPQSDYFLLGPRLVFTKLTITAKQDRGSEKNMSASPYCLDKLFSLFKLS